MWFSSEGYSQDRSYSVDQVKIHPGDDLRWLQPSFDDENWAKHQQGDTSFSERNYWYRFHVSVLERLPSDQATEIFFHVLGSSEVYWDGKLINRNGVIGHNKQDEIAGKIDSVIVIPSNLYTQGKHVIAIRISRYHQSLIERTGLRYDLSIGAYGQTNTQHTGRALVPIITLGATLVIACYFAILFFLSFKKVNFLLFSLCSFSVALMLTAETWRGIVGYTYEWHTLRLQIVLTSAALIALFLPWFIQNHFKLKKAITPLFVYSIGIVIFSNINLHYDFRATILLLIGLVVALFIAGISWQQKNVGAKLMFIGLLGCLLICLYEPRKLLAEYFFYGFPLLSIFILNALAIKNKQDQNQRDEALIYSERLKVELLKKNIQPHFLLNTLTSLSSWIAIEPKTADKMLHSLAQEFRLLLSFSDAKLVRLIQEIELCRHHLQVMTFRKDTCFKLQVTNMDNDLLIPPGIIHTLVENAITQNSYRNQEVTFKLNIESTQKRITLTMEVPIEQRPSKKTLPSPAVPNESSELDTGKGMGTKYINARLNEAWPEQWQFNAYKKSLIWVNEISFPAQHQSSELPSMYKI